VGVGQMPQIRGVIRGASSTAAPDQNFSKPRSSTDAEVGPFHCFWSFS